MVVRGLLPTCGMRVFCLWLQLAGSGARGLCSCGMGDPELVGSVVAAHALSCPAACGILVPRPGIEPAFPALEGGFLTPGPPGKSWA